MKYKVLSNLRHNGEVFKKGDVVDMDSSIALGLIKDGVLESTEKTEEAVPLAPRVKKEKVEDKKEDDEEEKPEEGDGLDDMTKADLMAIVEEEEIENVKAAMKNGEIVQAIRKARNEKKEVAKDGDDEEEKPEDL